MVEDSELFTFAVDPQWRDKLDADIYAKVSSLLDDYTASLRRIQYHRNMDSKPKRKSDVERILFARAQEDVYDVDELYAQFRSLTPQRAADLFQKVSSERWHLIDAEQRDRFLRDNLSEFWNLHDLLTDFRHGGFRLLGNILSDLIDEDTAEKERFLARGNESEQMIEMLLAYAKCPGSDYKDTVSKKCREYLNQILPVREAVRYIVAVDHRDKLWDLVPEAVEKELREVRHAE